MYLAVDRFPQRPSRGHHLATSIVDQPDVSNQTTHQNHPKLVTTLLTDRTAPHQTTHLKNRSKPMFQTKLKPNHMS